MGRFFLNLSYNGSNYNGWQVQKNTPHTVQQVLEDKMSLLLREKIELVGCGRTDTGVNARGYVAHFDSGTDSLLENKKQWIFKFNNSLPSTVAIHDIVKVTNEAHARFHATERIYHYYISRRKDPFREPFTWHIYGDLDFEKMNRAAGLLMDYNDFTSFSKVNTQNKTNNCKINNAGWLRCGEYEWRFTISADRFLRGMVRAIVGTLVMVGRNRLNETDFKNIIESLDRKAAGGNAPANALFLAGIRYPEEIYV